ncbi:hypothetical protein [Mycobacterium intracellulare]|uniref:hypothetical protein n=1 Tax=Mycobacterium intracellulare TaxID=1767 RepID=UPI001FF8D83D|nr:hypothetical protein [Mycobacterium intracellulare]
MPEKMVNVPRAEILRLLGLSSDVDDQALQQAIDSRLADIEADKQSQLVSAAEQRAQAEDRRIVVCAVNDGRLTANKIEFWCDALQRDREGNRAILASLAPGLRPTEQLVVDAEVEATHRRVLERLGITAPPRPVAASEQLTPYQRAVRNAPGFGAGSGLADPFTKADVPPPVRISRGKPESLLTDRERADALQRRLGPRFHPGTKPLPKGDKWYQPGTNDPYMFDEATGQWRENPNYRPGD